MPACGLWLYKFSKVDQIKDIFKPFLVSDKICSLLHHTFGLFFFFFWLSVNVLLFFLDLFFFHSGLMNINVIIFFFYIARIMYDNVKIIYSMSPLMSF